MVQIDKPDLIVDCTGPLLKIVARRVTLPSRSPLRLIHATNQRFLTSTTVLEEIEVEALRHG
jgi:hypothetical protein